MAKQESRNVPGELIAAIKAANGVERSLKAHHHALVALIVVVARMAIEDALETLTLYTIDRHAKSPDTLCTKATSAWLRKHFGIEVREGVARRASDFDEKGFSVATLNAAKAEPWYELAKALAFKVPTTLSVSAIASQMLKMKYAGAELPDAETLYAEVRAEMVRQARGERFVAWTAEYEARAKAGKLPAQSAPAATSGAFELPVSPSVRILAA
jgi:hypothetical protein